MFWRETLRGFSTPTPLGVDQADIGSRKTEPQYHDQVFHLSASTTEEVSRKVFADMPASGSLQGRQYLLFCGSWRLCILYA